MKIGRSPDGKWIIVEDKTTIAYFDTKDEAIDRLRVLTYAPTVTVGKCKHGNLRAEECALGPENLNQAWFGRYCPDCKAFLLRNKEEVLVGVVEGVFGETLFLLDYPQDKIL